MAQYVGLPYAKNSKTSKAAAKSMVKHAPNQREVVWKYVYQCGKTGATCEETEIALGMRHQSCSTRMQELRQLGRLAYNGKRRRTVAKRKADVHVIVDPADWEDKRPGWPTPTEEQRKSEKQKLKELARKWEQRAEYSKALYHEAQHRIEELEKELEELNEQN